MVDKHALVEGVKVRALVALRAVESACRVCRVTASRTFQIGPASRIGSTGCDLARTVSHDAGRVLGWETSLKVAIVEVQEIVESDLCRFFRGAQSVANLGG